MWGAYFLNYCDRQVVFSFFPVLKAQLGFTDTQLGLTGSIFLWVYGIGCPIAGQIGDRFSKRVLVVLSLGVERGDRDDGIFHFRDDVAGFARLHGSE